MRYLVSKYGPEEIYPVDPVKRARAEQWMDWANYETSISLRGAFLGGQLDVHLQNTGPYITGEHFTIGDIPIGLVVNRWFHLQMDRPDYPAVSAYYERLSLRPPYRTHVRNGLP